MDAYVAPRRSKQPDDNDIPEYPFDLFPLPLGVVPSYLCRKVFGIHGSRHFLLPGARARTWMRDVVGDRLMKDHGIVARVLTEAAGPTLIPIQYMNDTIKVYIPWKEVAETNNYGPDDVLDIWTYQAAGTHTLVVVVNQEE